MTQGVEASPTVETRADYRAFDMVTTRWHDTDLYDHVNNVVFYSWIDTAVNGWLVKRGLLEIGRSTLVGYIVESGCRYFKPVSFPATIHAGIRVARIGTSSVRYEVGLFADDDPQPSAAGFFVHVYVDVETQRPTPLPEQWRIALSALATTSREE